MARPSLDPDKARQGGGIEPGNYLVTAACFRNVKSEYKAKHLALMLSVCVLDKDGDIVRGAEPFEVPFGFGEKSADAFTPGVGKSVEDDSSEDMGSDVDAEGNTVFCSGEEQFNASCAATVLFKSLVKQGYPKSILDRCWAPSFVGLKMYVTTMEAKDINTQFDTRLNIKPSKDGSPITYKVATKWLNPKYLGAGGEATATTTTAATTGTTAAPAASLAPTGEKKSPEDVAGLCLAKVAEARKGAKNAVKTTGSLLGFFVQAFASAGFARTYGVDLPSVRAFIEDQEWTKNKLMEMGALVEFNDEGNWTGKVTFS